MATPTMAVPAQPDRLTKQFRIDPDTWQQLVESVGEKRASSVLRRLVALYLRSPRVQQQVEKQADPSPDRRAK